MTKYKNTLLPLLVVCLALSIQLLPSGRILDLLALKALYALRGHLPAPSEVVMVAIDDQTYASLTASTNYHLPRRFIAEALLKLHELAPTAIILDTKFPKEKRDDPEGSQKLIDAISTARAPIWEGLETFAFIDDLVTDPQILNASPLQFSASMAGEEGSVIYLGNPLGNSGVALASPPVKNVVGPNTSPEILAALYETLPWSKPLIVGAAKAISVPPKDALINFYGPTNTIQRLSLGALLSTPKTREEAEKLKALINKKIVIIGYQSRQLARGVIGKDEFPVPVSSSGLFPLEIHATIIANLLDASWIAPLPKWVQCAAIVVVSILTTWVALWLTTLKAVAIILFIPIALSALATVLFTHYATFTPGLTTMILASIAALLIAIIQSFIRSQRFEQKVKQTFKFEIAREI